MTINLLFSEIKDRQIRLERIADFVEEQANLGYPVDFILLQEVFGGFLSGNSSLDLKQLLALKGLKYNLSYKLANGLPGVLSVGNAILSRCNILFTLSTPLPFVIEEPFGNLMIPLKRNAMMSRVKIPGFGEINVYNTHLCAFCDPEERLVQAHVLADFIKTIENFIWRTNPIILGGDFNTNLDVPDEFDSGVYQLITQDLGFVDTYSYFHLNCVSCCSAVEGFDGCTFAVNGNPYAFNLFTHEQETPERIDYIFTKGFSVIDSFVVFNEDPNWVSDHSAVLTRIGLY
jgi:maltose 6'-phosphate phosphatase